MAMIHTSTIEYKSAYQQDLEMRFQHRLVRTALERIFKTHGECKVHGQYMANVLALASEGFCHVEWREGEAWAIRK